MGTAICTEDMRNELFIVPVSSNDMFLAVLVWCRIRYLTSLSEILFLIVIYNVILGKVCQDFGKENVPLSMLQHEPLFHEVWCN